MTRFLKYSIFALLSFMFACSETQEVELPQHAARLPTADHAPPSVKQVAKNADTIDPETAIVEPDFPKAVTELTEHKGLGLNRIALGNKVVDRKVVGENTIFAKNAGVALFIDAFNSRSGEAILSVEFITPSNKTLRGPTLEIPPGQDRWRTWSKPREVEESGTWRALVRSKSGTIIGSQTFVVNP